MPHDVLISYSSHDKLQADAICNRLESQGIRCWIAPRDVPLGSEYADSIVQAIESAKVVVLVYSANADQSRQVRREVERAMSLGITLIPVRIEDAKMSEAFQYYVGSMHWLDAITPPLEKHIDKLAHDLKALLQQPPEVRRMTKELVIPQTSPPAPPPSAPPAAATPPSAPPHSAPPPSAPSGSPPRPSAPPHQASPPPAAPHQAPPPAPPSPKPAPRPAPASAPPKSRLGLMIGAGVVVLALAGGGWYRLLGPGSTVVIPLVESGGSKAQADTLLRNAGLRVGAVLEDTSGKFDYDQPLRTDPPAGSTVKRNSAVTLYVSGMVMVPKDSGLKQPDAMKQLAQVGVDTEHNVVVRAEASRADAGTVVRQNPARGTRIMRSRDTVTLYVSGETFPLPNVVGHARAEAESQLSGAGLKPIVVPDWRKGATLGQVVATDPAAGAEASKGGTVRLTVAMKGGWGWISKTQLADSYKGQTMRWRQSTNLRDGPSGNPIGSETVRGGDSVRVLDIQRFPSGSWVEVVVLSPSG